jgi:hypothetical protein
VLASSAKHQISSASSEPAYHRQKGIYSTPAYDIIFDVTLRSQPDLINTVKSEKFRCAAAGINAHILARQLKGRKSLQPNPHTKFRPFN